MKYVQATEEAFSPQKRTSSTSKQNISKFFLILRVIFVHLDLDQGFGSSSTKIYADPDLPHCCNHIKIYGTFCVH
jgi:hypothetical protein